MLKDHPAHWWPKNGGGAHRSWHPKIDRPMTPPTARVKNLRIGHTKGFSPAAMLQRPYVSISRGRMSCVSSFPSGVGPPTRFNAAAIFMSMAGVETNVKMPTTRSMSTSRPSALLSVVLPILNSKLIFQTLKFQEKLLLVWLLLRCPWVLSPDYERRRDGER